MSRVLRNWLSIQMTETSKQDFTQHISSWHRSKRPSPPVKHMSHSSEPLEYLVWHDYDSSILTNRLWTTHVFALSFLFQPVLNLFRICFIQCRSFLLIKRRISCPKKNAHKKWDNWVFWKKKNRVRKKLLITIEKIGSAFRVVRVQTIMPSFLWIGMIFSNNHFQILMTMNAFYMPTDLTSRTRSKRLPNVCGRYQGTHIHFQIAVGAEISTSPFECPTDSSHWSSKQRLRVRGSHNPKTLMASGSGWPSSGRARTHIAVGCPFRPHIDERVPADFYHGQHTSLRYLSMKASHIRREMAS